MFRCFKDAKAKTVQDTKKAKQSIKKSFKGTKTKVKQDVKTVKQKVVNGLTIDQIMTPVLTGKNYNSHGFSRGLRAKP